MADDDTIGLVVFGTGFTVLVIGLGYLAYTCVCLSKRRTETTAAYRAVDSSPHNTRNRPVLPITDPTEPTPRPAASSIPRPSSRPVRTPAVTAVVRICRDPAIQRAKIPLNEIQLGEVLSHGAYGRVYRGVYDGEPVAIKQLLPARREDMKEIAAFLEEAKLMSALHHNNIVRLIGVAWDTRANSITEAMKDLSIVSEFMHGGDLRSLLSHSYETNAPKGFHSDNIRIAIDIAQALVYLHGLKPSAVVHRDLKSKNVLLARDLEAKLTDFGVSRERADATMTAGVGSYLWMAPEVVFGKRYDDKADVFSFGVVLSELDTHELPYSHAKDSRSGRKLTEMAIVKLVSEGALTVEFTCDADEEIVTLARASSIGYGGFGTFEDVC